MMSLIMMSLMRGLPLPQVLGDIEIAQTMKKDQEEASQKQQVIISLKSTPSYFCSHDLQLEAVPHPMDVNYQLLQTNMNHIERSDKIYKV